MSTLVYAALTTRRETAARGSSSATSPTEVKWYVDVVAALVPAEVLTLHGMILSVTTKTVIDDAGQSVTTIMEAATLQAAFWGLLALSVVLFGATRLRVKEPLDLLRVLIPPGAFVAWTMLQSATAFDAVAPTLGDAPRVVIALFGAVILGETASVLAGSADRKGRSKAAAPAGTHT